MRVPNISPTDCRESATKAIRLQFCMKAWGPTHGIAINFKPLGKLVGLGIGPLSHLIRRCEGDCHFSRFGSDELSNLDVVC